MPLMVTTFASARPCGRRRCGWQANDGYTDLRGKFDYASLSTGDLDTTTRFSVLIMSDTHGATVKEVQPPKR